MKSALEKEEILKLIKGEMPYLKERYGVEKIAIFGSYAKNKQTGKSDVDILVQLGKPLGFGFMELADYLENILGKKVDISTFDSFSRSKENPRYYHIALDVERSLIYV